MATEQLVLQLKTGGAEQKLAKLSKSMNSTDAAAKKLQADMPRASKAIKGTGKAAATATGNIQRMGVAFRTTLGPIVLLYGAINTFNKSLQVASERQVLAAQLTNGLKKLGATAADLEGLVNAADKLGKATLFDQEDFTRAFQLLTSFQRIGVDSYGRVAKAAADVATITGQDLRGAMIQLSKALEDPARRVTDLARSGTVFTEQQKEQIKTLQESGRLWEAQDLILREIEKQYGGAAEAAGKAGLAGALDSMNEELRDLQENLAGSEAVMGPVIYLVDQMTGSLKEANKQVEIFETFWGILQDQFPGTVQGLDQVGKFLDYLLEKINNVLNPLGQLLGLFKQVSALAGNFNDANAGQRNFGDDYASQEKALFEAAGGWTPYKPAATPEQPQGGGGGASSGARSAPKKEQKDVGEEVVKQLSREVELMKAADEFDRDRIKVRHELLDQMAEIETFQDAEKQVAATLLNEELARIRLGDIDKEQQEALLKLEKERAEEAQKTADASKGKIQNYAEQLKAELSDTEGMVVSLAQTVESALGSAMSSAIQGLITGTKTASEAFSEMFAQIGSAFIDMATQMIAKALILKALGVLGGGGGGGFTPTGGWGNFGSVQFAEGGYVTGPTQATVGEGGEPEYVIPASKMAGAMERYNSGVRGGGVIEGGKDVGGGGSWGQDSAPMITINGGVTNMGGDDFIRKDELPGIISQSSKLGEARTMRRLQMSPSARRKIGL